MTSWREIEKDHPEFAAKVKARFDVGTNKTIATLRRDGSPRISGTELTFEDGEVTFGAMADGVKLRDLRRDPRIAIHSPTVEPTGAEAKLAGYAMEVAPPQQDAFPDAGYFRVDLREVSVMYLGEPADHLVIESWDTTHGYRRRTRK
ncbi:pyridoxamine 5'-phosphate oxidase family protein [Actinoplanes sp. N902-109]|uniref:pyridoxamine 5'-phosphate oxidase family protein n=1 Tax=Actinoplanes sp. (strain N902-109) TaxID=649831 RepID=UPI0003294A5B|nr:pyridoxamine 5'-phosphate oxidase family protein [Actinoplanes sp. N902-109]AGL20370.1 pyridoxamine 5'-phosphate oxidase-like protein [Actinoplanes sp. N902-109]